jgi:hypothetical protein
LNEIVMNETGRVDSSYELEWNDYKNCILLTDNDGLRIVPTIIYDVFKLNEN